MTKLIAKNLSVIKDSITLVQDISFTLTPNELVIMLGPNGAGKSLALQHAAGIAQPISGIATLDGEDVQTLSPITRARKLSYLPQVRPLAWPSRVDDLVALGRFAHGSRLGKLASEDYAAIERAMQACDITQLAHRKANTLSGGELARVHCARAFAAETPLLIADEPVAALDPHHQFGIMELFKTYVAKGGGALVVLHDIGLAAKYADRLIWMQNGEIVAAGSVPDTLTETRLAEVYKITAHVQGRRVEIAGKLS